jgi:hypothetical protein
LKDGAVPANGNFDFEFTVFNNSSGGSLTRSNFLFPDVPVVSGMFSVNASSGNNPLLG